MQTENKHSGTILIKDGMEKVSLYTHFNGEKLPEDLKKALLKDDYRWTDFQYLTRIIFCEMLKHEDIDGTTDLGITQHPTDRIEDIITVDIDNQTVRLGLKNKISFDEYTKV